MTKQITQAIVGLLGINFLIEAITTLAGSTRGISSEATISDYLFIFGQTIILFIAAVLCIRYRDAISSWLNKSTSNDSPTDVNMDRLECLAYRVIGILTLISTTPFFIMSYSNYFIKPMASIVGSNVTRYAAVQFIAALIDFSLSRANWNEAWAVMHYKDNSQTKVKISLVGLYFLTRKLIESLTYDQDLIRIKIFPVRS